MPQKDAGGGGWEMAPIHHVHRPGLLLVLNSRVDDMEDVLPMRRHGNGVLFYFLHSETEIRDLAAPGGEKG